MVTIEVPRACNFTRGGQLTFLQLERFRTTEQHERFFAEADVEADVTIECLAAYGLVEGWGCEVKDFEVLMLGWLVSAMFRYCLRIEIDKNVMRSATACCSRLC